MKNKLITIGFIGCTRCYLNITEEELESDDFISIYVVEFDDEFSAYSSVWID